MSDLDNVRPIRAWIQRVSGNGLPRHCGQYYKVAVLFLHWPNDDIGVISLARELATVYSQLLKYNVEVFEIDAFLAHHNPTQNLSRRLMDLPALVKVLRICSFTSILGVHTEVPRHSIASSSESLFV